LRLADGVAAVVLEYEGTRVVVWVDTFSISVSNTVTSTFIKDLSFEGESSVDVADVISSDVSLVSTGQKE